MHPLAPVAVVAFLSPFCTAQSFFSSPPGFLDKDGGGEANISHPLEGTPSRNQYVDGDQRGFAKVITALAFRRDGYTTPSTSYNARTAMVAVVLAHANAAAVSTTFAANYVGSAATVIARRAIAFPSAVQPPPTAPAPWTLLYSFDNPFAYNGTQDLLWEIQTDSMSTTNPYSLDIEAQPFAPGFGSVSYTNPTGGCTTPNGRFSISYPFGPGTSGGMAGLRTFANGAPSNAQSVLALGLSDPGFTGGFCSALRTSAEVSIPAVSGPSGNLGTHIVSFPWTGGLLQVFAQYASLTGGQLYVSDGLRFLITNEFYAPKLFRVTAGSPSATVGTRYTSMIPVTRFSY